MAEVAPANKAGVLSLERMMYLRVSGLTHVEIGLVMGCTEDNVAQRLKPFREKLDSLRDFQANKGALYDLKQQDLYNALTPDKIEDMPGKDLIQGMKTLEDMGRKEKGLDMHQNINIFSLTVKAAHALPVNRAVNLQEVKSLEEPSGYIGTSEGIVEHKDGHDTGEDEELSGGVRGARLSENVGKEDLPEVPRDREPGIHENEFSGQGDARGEDPSLHLYAPGDVDRARTREAGLFGDTQDFVTPADLVAGQ